MLHTIFQILWSVLQFSLRVYIFCTNISINVLFVPFGANLARQMSKWATGKIHAYRRSPHEETAQAAVFV